MDRFISNTSESYRRLRQPLDELLDEAQHQRSCPKVPDDDWIDTGLIRVLKHGISGRDFLQGVFNETSGEAGLSVGQFFDALKSPRRRDHLRGLLDQYLKSAPRNHATLPGPADFPALDDFEIFAGDGHFHAASSHDERDYKGRKTAIGHLYTYNLRNFTCNHLALGNRKEPVGIQPGRSNKRKKTDKAHDMAVLKSLDAKTLRQGAAKGKKALYIWDKAGIDFQQWYRWKQASAIYFLSLEKSNMVPMSPALLEFDRDDPVNAGIISDELAGYGDVAQLRRITYLCPETGEKLVFLTNLNDTKKYPPGLIAQLYRMRWDIEKVFDVFKNKFGEIKAWAKSKNAKEMQAIFITLAHNLVTRLENEIQSESGLKNETNEKRQQKRLTEAREKVTEQGERLPKLYEDWQRIKQTGVTFIRWLRGQIFATTSWLESLALLRQTYEKFKA